MAKTKAKAKNGKKKTYTRKAPVYSLPYAKRRRVRFKYTWYGNLTQTSSATDTQQFRANSLFDPDLTGAGAQPRYFDQLVSQSLYTQYLVDKVHYSVKFINKDTAKDAIVAVTVRPDNSATLPTTSAQLWNSKELSRTTVRTILPSPDSKSRLIISGDVKLENLLGQSHANFVGNDDNSAAYNTNPANVPVINVLVADNPQDNSSVDCDVYVTLTYYANVFALAENIGQS